jgi:hypothetical protein
MLSENEEECLEGPVAYVPYVFHAYILSKIKEKGIKSVAQFLLDLRCCKTTNEKTMSKSLERLQSKDAHLNKTKRADGIKQYEVFMAEEFHFPRETGPKERWG